MHGRYAVLFVAYIAAYGAVLWCRHRLPPLPPDDAPESVFAAQRALPWLEHLTNTPHPLNSRENERIRSWLFSELQGLYRLAEVHGHVVEFFDDNVVITEKDSHGRYFKLPETTFIYESSNLLIRLRGTSENRQALMLTAHFDSVPTGFGATDDGIGVVTLLEVFRALIYAPRQEQDLIFAFCNGEETALFSSRAFKQHDLFNETLAFINLEGTGPGGRALLFRANNPFLLKLYAASVPYPHASVMGNDVFRLGLVQSGTDYDVYNTIRSGLDVAFYEHRSLYHTQRDSFENVLPESIQHIGENTLAFAKAYTKLADGDLISGTIKPNSDFIVFYDILGRFMIVQQPHEFALYSTVLLLTSAAIIFASIYVQNISVKTQLFGILNSLAILIIAIIAALTLTSISVAFLIFFQPLIVYRDVIIVQLLLFVVASYGVYFVAESKVQSGPHEQLTSENDFHDQAIVITASMIHIGSAVFWWFLALACFTLSMIFRIGALYFVNWFLIGASISLLTHFAFRFIPMIDWMFQLCFSLILPVVILLDMAVALTSSLSQTVADGSPALPGNYEYDFN